MKLITLVENITYKTGLLAEHGLSFYIEAESKKILFDTGQTDAFTHNALALGINLADVDAVVISHGHYDHAGGLNAFLRLNQKAMVYLKRAAFADKYHGTQKRIGVEVDTELLAGRVIYVDELLELDKGLFIVPKIPIVNREDTHFERFKVKKSGTFVHDTFEDELFVVADSADGLSIVSSCSHRGITNMVEAVKSIFSKEIKAVIGGFHIAGCSAEQLEYTIRYFEQLAPKDIAMCHCTGVDKYAAFLHRMPNVVFYNSTGLTLTI